MRTLQDFLPITDSILNFSTVDWSFECQPPLSKILEDNPRLVVVFNHSSPLSWVPGPCLLAREVCEAGFGHRAPLGIMDRFFYQVPFLRWLAEFVTQSAEPLSFREIIEHFKQKKNVDLVLFPEGSNCFFGDPEDIQVFRSPRFIEIAVRAEVPLLLCVHKGSEKWAKALQIGEPELGLLEFLPEFLKRRVRESGVFTMPLPPTRIDHFEMKCELYYPNLALNDLSLNEDEARAQIAIESERVRERMIEMLGELGESAGHMDFRLGNSDESEKNLYSRA